MSEGVNAVGSPAAPGGPSPAGSILRAAFFIDGFNLYHAIDELGMPHLKWLNLDALARAMMRRGEQLEYVVWCTAEYTKNAQKQQRHRDYRKALASVGVECLPGHFVDDHRECDKCGYEWSVATEKQGDLNVGLRLISDAHLGMYDVSYLVSADSDQLATVRLFRKRFPHMQIVSVAPPRRAHSKAITAEANDTRVVRIETLERCLFEGPNLTHRGRFVANRPQQYAPPAGWRRP